VATFRERLGLEVPIVQAGMGGGLAQHELAGAVSAAGGLGTIGFLNPRALRAQVAAVRRITARPVAVNLLLPFARAAHFEAASEADVVVTFWGVPQRRTPKLWIHQCGSLEEAQAARNAGADAVIAQGVEAGGHVRGMLPAAVLLARLRDALPDDYPILSAGGIAERSDVVARLESGAEAAVCGTRFLMTDESRAHAAYKARVLDADRTVVTELFGAGWPAPHRVVANAATARWLTGDSRGPAWLRALYRAGAPLMSRLPDSTQMRLATRQTPTRPPFGPHAATAGGPASLVEAGPLYAGTCVERIRDIRPARDIVRSLAP
jgi:nitronate monooxygenase